MRIVQNMACFKGCLIHGYAMKIKRREQRDKLRANRRTFKAVFLMSKALYSQFHRNILQ